MIPLSPRFGGARWFVSLATFTFLILTGLSVKADPLVLFTFGPPTGGQATGNGAAAPAAYSDVTNSSFLSSATAISTNPAYASGVVLTYRTSGTLVNQSGGQGTAPAFATLNAQIPNGTYPASPDPNRYFQFSMTANADFNLTTLSFDMSMGSTSTSTRGADVLYSFDNFATSVDLGSQNTGNQTADNYFYYAISLGNAAVANGQTITFRFEPYSTSGGGVRFDNIEVDGAAVPEPATAALFGFAGVALTLFRRRRA